MAVRLHHINGRADIRWDVCPLAEMGSLLAHDVAAFPSSGERYPCREEVEQFSWLYSAFRSPLFYSSAGPGNSSIDEALTRLETLDEAEFQNLLSSTLERVETNGTVWAVRDSVRFRDELTSFLRSYVDQRFADYWNLAKPRLEAHVAKASAHARVKGVSEAMFAAIEEARPGLIDGTVLIDKYYNASIDCSKSSVILLPTLLNWPKVLVKDEVDPVFIQYALRDPEGKPAISADLVERQIEALNRQYSLEILREVAKRPIGTTELAGRLMSDPPTISRALKELAAAGLIHREAVGRRRIYSIDRGNVAALGENLWQVISR